MRSGHVTGADGKLVCAVKLSDMGAAGDANARLIAAAPDLLKLLGDARNALLDDRIDDLRGILAGDICMDAIAKAGGAA